MRCSVVFQNQVTELGIKIINGHITHFVILKRKTMCCSVCLQILSAEGSSDEPNL